MHIAEILVAYSRLALLELRKTTPRMVGEDCNKKICGHNLTGQEDNDDGSRSDENMQIYVPDPVRVRVHYGAPLCSSR